ncbi:hypothetical protein D8X77_12635 [Vibrio vulnificus]|nr:hypothetical protein [Vibrio vulnificus]EHU4943789.1 hypothetical protein [Vibrio vulnificus]MCU8421636.1 hypothetical protein [Vibrio vulnificus]MCU8456890.1 hypothetical protein [Vibrio vulnificus]
MFFDLKSYVYISFFLLFFALGSIVQSIFPNVVLVKRLRKNKINASGLEVTLVLLFCLSILMFSIIDLFGRNQGLIGIFLTAAGSLKSELNTNALFIPIIYFTIGICFWSFNKYLNHELTKLQGYLTFATNFLLVSTMVIMAARYLLMPFLSSLFVIFINRKVRSKEITPKIIIYISLILALIIASFVTFQIMRGGNAMYGLIGYGPASFNRMSAYLNGEYELYVNKLYYISSIFKGGWSTYSIIQEEHDAVQRAGLDWALNWMTMYGYIYHSLGWFSLGYSFLLGMIYQFFWNGFYRGGQASTVVYPWLFSCSMLWFSYNILAYSQTAIFIMVGILLGGVQIVSYKKKHR